jgi:hypothetical protein
MKLIELKVKRKSLAAEAKIIRKEERKALSSARWELARGRAAGNTTLDPNKWADAARSGYGQFRTLQEHRKVAVRGASRAAHLAHAFLTGRTYKCVERSTKPDNGPNLYFVADNIRKFGNADLRKRPRNEIIGLLIDWRDNGGSVSIAAE